MRDPSPPIDNRRSNRKSRKFLVLHPATRQLVIRSTRLDGYVCIPLSVELGSLPPLHQFLHEIAYEELAKKRTMEGPTTAYCLAPPDAVVVVVGWCILQCIIPGIAWDGIKTAIAQITDQARSALTEDVVQRSNDANLLLDIGTPQSYFHLHLAIKRKAKTLTPAQQRKLLDGVIHKAKVRRAGDAKAKTTKRSK